MKIHFYLLLAGLAHGADSDLWITEVIPSTGQVEVTNVSNEAYTTSSALPFCHRRSYGTSVPNGTTFEAGESKIFTVNLANQADSDLWIYSSRSFGSSNALLNGLKWGPASSVGRTSVASSGQKWSSSTAFVTAPAEGQSLQLTGPNPFSSENWSVGEPNLGSFELTTPEAPAVNIAITAGEVAITWQGGTPPFQLFASTDLVIWNPIGNLTDERSASALLSDASARFFRVDGGAQP